MIFNLSNNHIDRKIDFNNHEIGNLSNNIKQTREIKYLSNHSPVNKNANGNINKNNNINQNYAYQANNSNRYFLFIFILLLKRPMISIILKKKNLQEKKWKERMI